MFALRWARSPRLGHDDDDDDDDDDGGDVLDQEYVNDGNGGDIGNGNEHWSR